MRRKSLLMKVALVLSVAAVVLVTASAASAKATTCGSAVIQGATNFGSCTTLLSGYMAGPELYVWNGSSSAGAEAVLGINYAAGYPAVYGYNGGYGYGGRFASANSYGLIASTGGNVGAYATAAPSSGGIGVLGADFSPYAFGGLFQATNSNGGYGVVAYGSTYTGYPGVYAYGAKGVFGYGANGPGVHGTGAGDGVEGAASASFKSGLFAHHDGANWGYGSWSYSAYGDGAVGWTSSDAGYGGVFFNPGSSTDTTRTGVLGLGANGSTAYTHPSGAFWEAGVEGSGANGVIGAASRSGGYGVIGLQGPGSLAGYFGGSVYISGNLNVGGSKNFVINDPRAPTRREIVHAAIEAPQMTNQYSGNITTDAAGYATVHLPSYFSAINSNFRYVLTPIGKFAEAIVAKEIAGNSFTIRTSKASVKVSWLVIATRSDPWAKQHPLKDIVTKAGSARGAYRTPRAYQAVTQPAPQAGGLSAAQLAAHQAQLQQASSAYAAHAKQSAADAAKAQADYAQQRARAKAPTSAPIPEPPSAPQH
jgi:hypothetical protein